LGAKEAPVLRIFVRRTDDLSYLESDLALEIDELRGGPARWAPLDGRTDLTSLSSSLPRRGTVLGYDLVFAAPRAASALLAVGSPHEGAAVVGAHRAAVTDALSYLERRAVVVRRRVLGDEDLLGGDFAGAAGFTHGINRAGEPHLHDHVVVPSRVVGRAQALDGRSLFAHAQAADAVYRSGLRHEISLLTGRDAWRSRRGIEHVGGVDEGVRALWPGRAERGEKRHWARGEARRAWEHDLERYEVGPSVPPPALRGTVLDEHQFAGAFEGLSPIARRDVVRSWADAAIRGAPIGSVDRAIDRHYPQFANSRGLDHHVISRNDARQLGAVREHGPRTLLAEAHRDGPERALEGPGRSILR
jgi:hypothetical protein